MNNEKIGKLISELRKEHQLTQEQLAEKLGVSNRSVSRWENGNTMPDLPTLLQLCGILNIEIGELMEGERKNQDTDLDKNIRVILQLSDRDRENKTKKLNFWFSIGAIFLGGTAFCYLVRDAGFLKVPVFDVAQLCLFTVLGLLCEFVGFYHNMKGSKTKTFSEKEIAALVMDEKNLRMREAEEMLQVARKHQRAELKQYQKAFQEIAGDLEEDEYAVFSMVTGSYTFNDSPGPWNVSVALTNKRLMLCGETVRGMLFTRYVMDVLDRREIRSVELVNRKIVIRTSKDTIKMEGEGFSEAINRLKRVF